MGAPETAATASALAEALRGAAEFGAKREALEAEVQRLERRLADLTSAVAEHEAHLRQVFDAGEQELAARRKDLADRLARETVQIETEVTKQATRLQEITAKADAAERAAGEAAEARRLAATDERLKRDAEARAAQVAASDAQCAAQVALSALEQQADDLRGRADAARAELKDVIERAQRLLSAAD